MLTITNIIISNPKFSLLKHNSLYFLFIVSICISVLFHVLFKFCPRPNKALLSNFSSFLGPAQVLPLSLLLPNNSSSLVFWKSIGFTVYTISITLNYLNLISVEWVASKKFTDFKGNNGKTYHELAMLPLRDRNSALTFTKHFHTHQPSLD